MSALRTAVWLRRGIAIGIAIGIATGIGGLSFTAGMFRHREKIPTLLTRLRDDAD